MLLQLDSACNMCFSSRGCAAYERHLRWRNELQSRRVLKGALDMKCFFFFFSTLLRLYDACSYKVIVGASKTHCQISSKLMFISESMFVTSHINKHNHMYWNDGHSSWAIVQKWNKSRMAFFCCWEEGGDLLCFSTQTHRKEDIMPTQSNDQYSFSHCAWKYRNIIATTSHSWLYFLWENNFFYLMYF